MAEQTVEEQEGATGDETAEEQDSRGDRAPEPEAEIALAVWSAEEMRHAIFEAVRDELESDLTDDELADSIRMTDKYVLQGPDGAALVEFEVGRPYPAAGLEASRVVGIFLFPDEDSMPGDVRIYAAVPTLPVAGVADHLCYTFNRATMTTRREKMSRDLFVEEVAGEIARGMADDEEEDEEDEEEEDEDTGPACADEECGDAPTYVCICQTHAGATTDDGKFFACSEHRGEVASLHLKETGRPPKWQKLPPATPALTVAGGTSSGK